MERYEGALTALTTHFNSDGTIDYKGLERHVEYQIANGINGLVPCGTTGQSPTLTWDEHNEINRRVISVRDRLGSKIPVIVGAGSNNTAEAVEATKHAADDGADVTLHVTGYYNMPSQDGFADYFEQVADAAPIGVLVYNIPGRGHPIIQADVMAALAKAKPNIWGTKDATGGRARPDDEYASFWKAVRHEARKRGLADNEYLILSGDDPVTFYMMTAPEIAANGVISVWSNIFPYVYSEMTSAILKGEYHRAKEINESLKELNGLVGARGSYVRKIGNEELTIVDDNFRNPQPVQFAAYLLGMSESLALRSPMRAPPPEIQQQVGSALYNLHEKQPDYFEPMQKHFNPKPVVADRLMFYRNAA